MEKEKRFKTCCFTGHRGVSRDFDNGALYALIEEFYLKENVRVFICGGAVGFDMVAAASILRLKKDYPDAQLWLFLPCLDQDKKWSDTEKRVAKTIKEMADYIDCPQVTFNRDVMRIRNYKMVDNSDFVISYFNGKMISGTAQTIRYANRKGVPVYNVGTGDAGAII